MANDEANPSNVKDVIDAATGLVKAIPVYDDAIKPAAKEVGKGLETIAKTVNIALSPVSALVWGYSQIENFINNKVAEKLKHIPAEKIITPEITVAGPTLEALKFAGHQVNLREMYANLLATAMNLDVSVYAHPSFVEIIKQLDPLEAEFVKKLAELEGYPHVIGVYHTSTSEYGLFNYRSSETDDIEEHIVSIGKEVNIKPEMSKIYLSNLLRLRILETVEDVITYEDWSNLSNEMIEDTDLSRNLGVEQKITINLRFSKFGRTFVNVCVRCNEL